MHNQSTSGRAALSSGFSGFSFGSDEKGEYVTMRTDTEGFTNSPSWMLNIDKNQTKSYTKIASNDATFVNSRR